MRYDLVDRHSRTIVSDASREYCEECAFDEDFVLVDGVFRRESDSNRLFLVPASFHRRRLRAISKIVKRFLQR